jgi:hypothetical protein
MRAVLDVTDHWRHFKQAGADRRVMGDDVERAVRGTSENPLSEEDLLVWHRPETDRAQAIHSHLSRITLMLSRIGQQSPAFVLRQATRR